MRIIIQLTFIAMLISATSCNGTKNKVEEIISSISGKHIRGIYISANGKTELEFKGNKIVVINDKAWNIICPAEYVIDGDYISIETTGCPMLFNATLLFKIIDNKTLEEEAYNLGTYTKQ